MEQIKLPPNKRYCNLFQMHIFYVPLIFMDPCRTYIVNLLSLTVLCKDDPSIFLGTGRCRCNFSM